MIPFSQAFWCANDRIPAELDNQSGLYGLHRAIKPFLFNTAPGTRFYLWQCMVKTVRKLIDMIHLI